MGGYQQLLRGEPMRAKFRNSWEKPRSAGCPERSAELNFTMPDVNHTFRKGHRIMVQIQSSWFPLVDRNPQTFVEIPDAKPEDFKKATEQVFHNGGAASGVEVMVATASRSGSGRFVTASTTSGQTSVRVDHAGDAVGEVGRGRSLRGETSDGSQPACFAAPVLRHEVRGDAVEPRSRDGTFEVVGVTPFERDAEDVADHRLCLVGPESAHEVPVQHRRMAVEDLAEPRRLVERRGDDGGVRLGLHTDIFPAAIDRFRRTPSPLLVRQWSC